MGRKEKQTGKGCKVPNSRTLKEKMIVQKDGAGGGVLSSVEQKSENSNKTHGLSQKIF